MSKRATEALLAELHSQTAEHLITRLKSGQATPAEVSNAIRFLKDNGIEAVPEANDALHRIVNSLPDFEDSEDGLHTLQ